MKIITTRADIELEDGSGYHFTIHAEEQTSDTPEVERWMGWRAKVSLGHHHSGAASLNGVLSMLLTEAKQLVRMLEKEVPEKDR
jgi:hypothetical protein